MAVIKDETCASIWLDSTVCWNRNVAMRIVGHENISGEAFFLAALSSFFLTSEGKSHWVSLTLIDTKKWHSRLPRTFPYSWSLCHAAINECFTCRRCKGQRAVQLYLFVSRLLKSKHCGWWRSDYFRPNTISNADNIDITRKFQVICWDIRIFRHSSQKHFTEVCQSREKETNFTRTLTRSNVVRSNIPISDFGNLDCKMFFRDLSSI